eukprot:237420-Rhodomonas_salina.1
MDTDPVAVAAHITKKQKVLSVLQLGGHTPTQGGQGGHTGGQGGHQGPPRGGGGAQGGYGGRGGGHGGGSTGSGFQFPNAGSACNICQKWHKGDPPEDHCYQQDIAAECLKLDKLEESKKKADARSKESTEQ